MKPQRLTAGSQFGCSEHDEISGTLFADVNFTESVLVIMCMRIEINVYY